MKNEDHKIDDECKWSNDCISISNMVAFKIDMSVINSDCAPEIQVIENHLNKLSPENRKKFLELFKTPCKEEKEVSR